MKLSQSLFIALVLIFTASCSKSPLHEPMENMGEAFHAITEAEDLSSVTAEIDAFVAAVKVAKAQTVPEEHQEKFNEGIGKTLELAESLQAAVASGDMATAGESIKGLGKTVKKYHELFGVED